MFNIGPEELILILVIALLVFGPSKLPEVARSIGRGLREFRRASDQIRGEIGGLLDLDDDATPTADRPQDVPDGPSVLTGADAGSTNPPVTGEAATGDEAGAEQTAELEVGEETVELRQEPDSADHPAPSERAG